MTIRVRWALSLVVIAALGTVAAIVTTTPAAAISPAVPLNVALTGGGSMSIPHVTGDGFAFDLTVPRLADGAFVTPLAWNTADTYWEIAVDSTSIYVQWSRGASTGLAASTGRIDDGRLHHITVKVRPASVTVDGATVASTSESAGPIVGVTLNPPSH